MYITVSGGSVSSYHKAPDFTVIQQQLKQPLIFDGRNLFDPASVLKKGIHYVSIGRPLNSV